MTRPAICWFRRDLRLSRHPALAAAAKGRPVLGLFVLDPRLWGPAGPNRRRFLSDCLAHLIDASRGAIIIRHGRPEEVVPEVAAEVGAVAVHVTGDHSPFGTNRDLVVARALSRTGVELRWHASNQVVRPGSILTGGGTRYKVFTPYYRQWAAAPREEIGSTPEVDWWDGVPSDGLPLAEPGAAGLIEGGEPAARERLNAFLEGPVGAYGAERDLPAVDGTSRLSADLKFGTLHPVEVLERAEAAGGAEPFIRQLAFRDFYTDVLDARPETAREPVNTRPGSIEVDEGPLADERFAAWCAGRTGYPIVDAGMRQLSAEGWMHNRVRMITASFLVKDLHLDWRRGAKHFMTHLVDGDVANNQHGWQWVAGCGTDASPYHRVFNPTAQSKKFDPDGHYIRRWVPELVGVPAPAIHAPHAEASLFVASDYPPPLVDHAEERLEALARLELTKSNRPAV